MTSASTAVGVIVDGWMDRLARGEAVDPTPDLAAYPDLADRLRELLSALGAVTAARGDGPAPALAGYRIVREVGRGGMGVVYEAVDETLGRRVAVKVLPPHLAGHPEYLARFRREARTAAGLHHTHIVPVFGVGEQGGVHFIVLQFIPGRPASADAALTPDRVADIGAKLADALACAHAAGVLHRDIKPGNVLIDDGGEPWLADFGLARAAEADGMTDPDAVVGTLRYTAPERFRGVTDERSDVYGLGLTLCELATGRPAFDGPDRAALMKAILETDPARPRAANPAIPRDLETVLLKAVAKDPAHRYPTAAAFADDLRRVRAGLPILARRIGPLGQLKRWAKRHPVIAGLATALLLAVLAGTTTVTLLWRQSERRRVEADLAFQQARDAVDECFLAATEHASFQGPGLQPAKEELLRRAGKYYERFLTQRANDPAVRGEVARARLALGTISHLTGAHADAVAELNTALALFEALAAGGDPAAPPAVARCHRLLGQSLIQLGRRDEAGQAHAAATAQLEALRAVSPEDAALRLELGRVCAQEGRRLTDAFQNAEAEVVLRRGMVALTSGAADDPTAQLVLARLHYGLTLLLRRLNRVPESATHLHEMDRITRRLLALDPNRDEFLEEAGLARKAIGSFALIHGDAGKPYGWHMTTGYREGADLYRRLHARHDTILRYRANLAQALDSLGVCLRLEYKYADSEACFREALTHFDELVARNQDQPELKIDLAKTRHDFGALLHVTGRLDEARGQYDQAIRIQQALIEKDGHKRHELDLAISQHSLGIACERGRDDATAETLFTRAIDVLARLLLTPEKGNQDFLWNAWMSHYSRGMLRWRRGERDGAAADFASPTAGDAHVWRGLFLRAFRGDAAVVADAERLAAAEPSGGAAIDAAAVIAMSGTFPGLTAAERDRRRAAAVGLLKTAERLFAAKAVRVDFLTRRELDPLGDHQEYRRLRQVAEQLDRKK